MGVNWIKGGKTLEGRKYRFGEIKVSVGKIKEPGWRRGHKQLEGGKKCCVVAIEPPG